MRIDLVFPALPPALDGIGDYTAQMAAALAALGARVRILTAQRHAIPIQGVEILCAFGKQGPGNLDGLEAAVATDVPDVLLVQYNPFSWGRYGFAPHLPERLLALKRRHSGVKLAVMMHEPFVPVTSWKFGVMTTWQRWQLWRMGHVAEVFFCSVEPWAARFARWFPGTQVDHLPIGSNIPVAGANRSTARQALGVKGRLVMSLFGRAACETLGHVRAAADAVGAHDPSALVLYIGTDGARVQAALDGRPVRNAGALPAADVSRALAATDLYLAPYPDGASTRRGTLMAGLAHGLPTVSTDGRLTDPLLRAAGGSALVLAPASSQDAFAHAALSLAQDSVRRAQVGTAGQYLYERAFDWPVVARRLLHVVGQAPGTRRALHAVSERIAA